MARDARIVRDRDGNVTVHAPPAVHARGVPILGIDVPGVSPDGLGALKGAVDPPTPAEIIQAQATMIRDLLDQREQDLTAMKDIGRAAIAMTQLYLHSRGEDPTNGWIDIPNHFLKRDDVQIDISERIDGKTTRIGLLSRAPAPIVSGEGTL